MSWTATPTLDGALDDLFAAEEDAELERLAAEESLRHGSDRERVEFAGLLGAIVADPVGFTQDAAGCARLMELVRRRLVGVVRKAGRARCYEYEPGDAVSMILANLLTDTGGVCAKAIAANDPFAWVGGEVRSWVHAEIGEPPRIGQTNTYYQVVGVDEATMASAPSWDAFDRAEEHTPLKAAVLASARLLHDYTASCLEWGELVELVSWFAVFPPRDQSRDTRELGYAASRFPEHAHLVGAFANLLWGGRPHRRDTSLLHWYLNPGNQHWHGPEAPDPRTSATHHRALRLFITRLRTATAGTVAA